jgi:phosphinothricin acetyltransferase
MTHAPSAHIAFPSVVHGEGPFGRSAGVVLERSLRDIADSRTDRKGVMAVMRMDHASTRGWHDAVFRNRPLRALSHARVRPATVGDAEAITAIYAPVVAHTTISFEVVPPSVEDMRARIATTLKSLPWLVSLDDAGRVDGYVYASRHRERAAYQWAVDVSAYVREDARRSGVGRRLYDALFLELVRLGYCQAFAGVALPNAGSVGLHEAMGFQPIGVYRNVGFKLGRWHDVGWWQKELQRPDHPDAPARFGGA